MNGGGHEGDDRAPWVRPERSTSSRLQAPTPWSRREGPPADSGLRLPRPPTPPASSGSSRRWLVAVVIGVVVALASAVVVFVAAGGDDGQSDPDRAATGSAAVVDMLGATRGVTAAIVNERDATVVMIIGQEELFAGAIVDLPRARASTDEAVAAFRDEVASLAPAAAERYGDVLVGVGRLVDLRAEVDAQPGPAGLDQLAPVAVPLRDRYTTLVASVLDAHDSLPPTIDDPELRSGAELHALALRQQEARLHLVDLLLTGGLVPEPDPDFLTDLTAWADTYRRGLVQLAADADGTVHQATAERLTTALADDPIPVAAEEVVSGGPIVVQTVLDTITQQSDAMGWLDFAAEVESAL